MPDCVRFNIVPGIAVIAIGLVWGTAPVMAQSKKPLLRLGERPVAVVSPKIDCTSVSRSSYYGHLPYAQAPQEELVSIGNGERLRRGAASSFWQMQGAAEKAGIALVPLSGFRDRVEQDFLFYDIAARRGQSLSERARTSAPPGYSEHHTGYAVDIGDDNDRSADFHRAFAQTDAGRWLLANAGKYGFELSFPDDAICVSYEPWHWRWVGDPESEQAFQTARDLYGDRGISESGQLPDADTP
ncbi:MAG: M15 family metallopeptidase [Geitlerinemataceae cyanobacterium]